MTFVLPHWTFPPERLSCGCDEVHLWLVSLDNQTPEVEQWFKRILSEEEFAKADRFATPRNRRRYIACHSQLRLILSGYLNLRPEALSFRYDTFGKPQLETEAGTMALRFSVSHSEGIALISVSRGRATGVDLERLRPHLASPWIAEHFFLPDDASRLKQLQGDSYVEGFFVCWTRMEAYLKACGLGLSGLGRGESEDSSAWTLYDLAPGPGYVGAIAVEGQDHRLSCWDLGLHTETLFSHLNKLLP